MKDNLIAGFVSGLIVTAFVVVLRQIWIRIVVPWFEERVYKDARIEGSWFSLYPTEKRKRQEAITLQRRGHAVTGTIICTVGGDEGEQYELTGSFRNLILPLIYESLDRAKTDRGTITLRLVRNAERFEGKVALYHTPSDRIAENDVIWFRTKAALEIFLRELEKEKQQLEQLAKRRREAEDAVQKLSKQLDTPGGSSSEAAADAHAHEKPKLSGPEASETNLSQSDPSNQAVE